MYLAIAEARSMEEMSHPSKTMSFGWTIGNSEWNGT